MTSSDTPVLRGLDEDAALRVILEATVTHTGQEFFAALVESVARALGTQGAWVTEYLEDARRLRSLAFWLDGKFVTEYEYDVAGTPCEPVIMERSVFQVPDRVFELYPEDPDLAPLGAVSYMGAPMLDANGKVLGHFAVLDNKPLPEEPQGSAIFRIFAARAAAELQRISAESVSRARTNDGKSHGTITKPGSDEILCCSTVMQELLQDVERVAATGASVLIQGETGTGKELIARAVHHQSSRRHKPLVVVNCAAIPVNLIESEFFGHERGAFTGAMERKKGRFEAADGGTIFLDEIGELPLELQPKLLRALQEGEVELVGSTQPRKVDVRVLAATNRDLQTEVDAGTFRADLFFRLNGFPLRIAPLRERKEDIPLLAQAFAERLAAEMDTQCEPIDADMFRGLQAYPWPGNVRELQNVIGRALITARDGRLDLDRALPETTESPAEPDGDGLARDRVWTVQELSDLERRNLIRALESTGWRVSGKGGAAELLGLRPSTLSSRLKALGITRPGTN